ncbi:chemotaxis protein [Blastopirellula retiformator]|uniref:CheY-P phosphatase CheC n=1 Tax=Blastopirellula retiformator TaxID=2527970 RepID=A0A5C5V050_9BACT|nr:chemotaxis protein [Blastopirellula retiformator]TWT31469.1 CheY-P phosphatase CheC [Blastopirellula retiformator]
MSDNTHEHGVHLEILHQILSAATHEASAAMCRWTNGLITMSLDEVREIPLEAVSTEYDFGLDMLTMVVLTLNGEIGGSMILCFDEENGRDLAASLLCSKQRQTGDWTPLERSALCETGNILGCAYLNALTRLMSVDLVPSPPYFLQDYGASVLEQALMEQAALEDKVMICRTRFTRGDQELNWNVFFVPNSQMRQMMEDALHIDA